MQGRGFAAGPEAGKAARRREPLVLIKSGLVPDDLALLKSFGGDAGVRVVSKWTDAVTHIVCGLERDRAPKCAPIAFPPRGIAA